MLILINTLLFTVAFSNDCCNQIYISGFPDGQQQTRDGLFSKVDGVMSEGLPVYQNADDEYLRYWGPTSDWVIHSDMTSNIAGVASSSNIKTCPTEGLDWMLYDGSSWISEDISVMCVAEFIYQDVGTGHCADSLSVQKLPFFRIGGSIGEAACVARCDGDNACLGYTYDQTHCFNFYGASRLTVPWNAAWEEGPTTQFESESIDGLYTGFGDSSAICMKKLDYLNVGQGSCVDENGGFLNWAGAIHDEENCRSLCDLDDACLAYRHVGNDICYNFFGSVHLNVSSWTTVDTSYTQTTPTRVTSFGNTGFCIAKNPYELVGGGACADASGDLNPVARIGNGIGNKACRERCDVDPACIGFRYVQQLCYNVFADEALTVYNDWDAIDEPSTSAEGIAQGKGNVGVCMRKNAFPTPAPTFTPTHSPSTDPTVDPTLDPTMNPSTDPTIDPTLVPTTSPSTDPTVDPTVDPTTDPTNDPTVDPTMIPSTDPTVDPTVDPTMNPSTDPTLDPTASPSMDPTVDPTVDPTINPSTDPTVDPTLDPTASPSMDPTDDPTMNPTIDPTLTPTVDPTIDPTLDPTVFPTFDPTLDPTLDPTTVPSLQPTATDKIEQSLWESSGASIVYWVIGTLCIISLLTCAYLYRYGGFFSKDGSHKVGFDHHGDIESKHLENSLTE